MTEQAWGFDGSRRLAGVDHAVRPGEKKTLCGLKLNPSGYPTGEPFRPHEPYACKRCRKAAR